jgi:hypothetical protein
MTTALIVYLLLGLVLGWFACRRLYDKHLKTANEQRKQAFEALGKANALTTLQDIKLQGLQLENNQLRVKLERASRPSVDVSSFPA